jgi:hypothetical protein
MCQFLSIYFFNKIIFVQLIEVQYAVFETHDQYELKESRIVSRLTFFLSTVQ